MTDFLWKMPVNPLVGGGSGSGTGTTYTPPTVTGSIDHVAAALDRLPQQFKGKPNIEALITALVSPANVLEDALQQMLLRFSIDNGEGVQLDNIGNIVGQPRNGLTDASYKRYLRARILTNRSDGKPGTLRKIARLILGTNDGQVITQRMNNATCQMLIQGLQVDAGTARALITFLSHAPGAGIRFLLETLVYPQDQTFTMATETTLATDLVAGSTAALVASTDGFPPTGGTLLLNFGTTPTETVTYSTTFIHSSGSPAFRLTAGPSNTYAAGVSVMLGFVAGECYGSGYYLRDTETPSGRSYPVTEDQTNGAIGYGMWSAGWLCDDTSAPLQPAFGSPTLAAAGLVLGVTGALDDSDKAVTGSAIGGDVFDPTTNDLVLAAVVKAPAGASTILSKSNGTGALWSLGFNSTNQITFTVSDGTNTAAATTTTAFTNTWVAVLAVLDRTTGKVRVGAETLDGVTIDAGTEVSASAVGSIDNTQNFTLGGTTTTTSAAFIGTGAAAATGLSANLQTALANFVASLS